MKKVVQKTPKMNIELLKLNEAAKRAGITRQGFEYRAKNGGYQAYDLPILESKTDKYLRTSRRYSLVGYMAIDHKTHIEVVNPCVMTPSDKDDHDLMFTCQGRKHYYSIPKGHRFMAK